MTPSFFLSILIIGADITIATLLVFAVWHALLVSGRPAAEARRSGLILGLALFGWLALTIFLGGQGTFRSAVNQPFPSIALAIGIPIVLGAFLIFRSSSVRKILEALPQSWLVGLQFYRVIGVTFLVLHSAGQLPGVFALPAGYGDIFVGITALLVAFGYARHRSQFDSLVALWNWIGIADLVIALSTGFLSAPSRFQLFSLDAPNFLIGSFPLVLIPIYAVPLSIILHLASLTKLRPKRRPIGDRGLFVPR